MSVTSQTVGKRHYLKGDTFAIKDQLRAAGCRWDPEERAWWTGKAEVAARFTAPTNTPSSAPCPGEAKETLPENEVALGGRGKYKGSTYYLFGCVERGRTHWDDRVELVRSRTDKYKLASRDGSRVFWAAVAEVQVESVYKRLTSIAKLQEFAEQRKSDRQTGTCSCRCHREPNAGRPGSTLYDGCDRCGCEAC